MIKITVQNVMAICLMKKTPDNLLLRQIQKQMWKLINLANWIDNYYFSNNKKSGPKY